MTEVWFRPRGTRRLNGPPTLYDLWYKEGANGHPVSTQNGRRDWARIVTSYEFHSMEELIRSGVVYRVRDVGDKTPFDPDYYVDEGL